MSAQPHSQSSTGYAQLAIFQPGDRCASGRYVIRDLISCGGFAEVYEAHDEQSGGVRALKVLQARHHENESAIRRMLQEAKMGIALNHPNLVRVYDAGVDDGTSMMYFSMERLQGKTLLELLSFHGKIPLVTALDWVIEVADAVHVLNEIGIVHRDLKLENIFVTTEGVIKVLDLGNMRYERSGMKTTQGPITGTALYMSPEHIRGEKVDRRADVYALAMIFYELVAGVHPLLLGVDSPPSMMEITSWQLNKPIAPMQSVVPDISIALSRIVEQGLAKDRKKRHPTAAVLSNMLRGVTQAMDKLSNPAERAQNNLLKSSLVIAPSQREARIAAGLEVSPEREPVAESGLVRRPEPLGLPTAEQPTELAPALDRGSAALDKTGKGTFVMVPNSPPTKVVAQAPAPPVAPTAVQHPASNVGLDVSAVSNDGPPRHPDQQAAAAFAKAYEGETLGMGAQQQVLRQPTLQSASGRAVKKGPPMWLGVLLGFVAAMLLIGGLFVYRGASPTDAPEPNIELTPPPTDPGTSDTEPTAPVSGPAVGASSSSAASPPASSATAAAPTPPAAPSPSQTQSPPKAPPPPAPSPLAPATATVPSHPPPSAPPKAPGRLF